MRTADPIKRGLTLSDFPRTIKVADNVYTYEDFHSGDEKFTTTNMFVVTRDGVVVADGQGGRAETRGLVDAIAKVTPQPIKYVVICSDHGDHTAGNASFPPGVTYIIHPTSKAILDRSATGWKLSVALPRQKILFLSETFLNRVFSAMRSAYPTEWLRALDKAEVMKADVYIPEAIQHAKWGEYATWTLAASQEPIAIRKVYEELDGKLR